MRALSMIPENAFAIAAGYKTIELRSWTTDHRGDILICASSDLPEEEQKYFIAGHALAVANLVNIVPFEPRMAHDADIQDPEEYEGAYAWLLKDIRPIVPVPVGDQKFLFEHTITPQPLEQRGDAVFEYWVAEGYIEEYPDSDEDDDDDDDGHDHGHHHH